MDDDLDEAGNAASSWAKIEPNLSASIFEVALRLRRLEKVRAARHTEVVRDHGFSVFGDYEVATLIRRRADGLTPRQITRVLRITTAGLTGRLDRLERQGLILREPNPDDGRSVTVRLTAEGRTKAVEALRAVQESDARLLAPLTADELAAIRTGLRRVLAERDPAIR